MGRYVVIEKVDGGYILTVPFPHASYSSNNKLVEKDWTRVLKLLKEVFRPEEDD